MVAEFLMVCSAVLATAYFVHALLRGAMSLRASGLVLILSTMLALAALILDNIEDAAIDRVEYALLGAAVAWILTSSGMIFLRRWQESPGTHGKRGLGAGVVMILMALIVPGLLAAANLPGQIAVLPTPTPGPTPTMNNVALDVFDRVVDVIAEQTGLDNVTIATALDEGVSVGRLVRQHDGDLETVIQAITAIMTEQVQTLAAQERMNQGQAAVAISAMETVVRVGVESNLNGMLARFESDPRERAS